MRRRPLATLAAVALLGAGLSLASPAAAQNTKPAAPTGLKATPGDNSIILSWDASSDTSITHYAVGEVRSGNFKFFGDKTTSSYTVMGGWWGFDTNGDDIIIKNGGVYNFKVHADGTGQGGLNSATVKAVAGRCAGGMWSATGLTQELGEGRACGVLVPMSVSSPTFSSSDTAVATVDSAGIVETLTTGTATISATASGSTVFSMALTVRGQPGQPTDLKATATGDTEATLSWTVPASDSATMDYEYRYKTTDDYGDWTSSGVATRKAVGGLTSGAKHTFQVRATNRKVYSDPTNESAVTLAVPGLPTLEAEPGNAKVKLSWQPASTGGTPAVYQYTYKTTGGFRPWASAGAGAGSSFVVTGLDNGAAHTFKLRGSNGIGNGPEAAAAAVTPAAVPDPPLDLTAVGKDTKAELNWTAPAGSVTGYEYRYKTSSTSYTDWTPTASTGTTTEVTDLTNKTVYTFQVRAKNATGSGLSSKKAAAKPVPVPKTRTDFFVGETHNAAVRLNWNTGPSEFEDTSTLEVVEVQIKKGTADWGEWQEMPGSRSAGKINHRGWVHNLANNTAYQFKVRVRNSAGAAPATGAESATPMASLTAAPKGAPVPPTALTGESGDRQVKLSWTASAISSAADVYEYRHKTIGSEFTDWARTGGSDASHTVDGLTNGTAYTFQVRALNNWGASWHSNDLTATPGACAGGKWATTGLAQALAPDDTCTITIPSSVSGATFNSSAPAKATVDSSGVVTAKAAGTATITGTVSGSTVFSMALTVKARPSKPTGLTAKPFGTKPTGPNRLKEAQVRISWTAPASGATPTGYQYRQKTPSTGYSEWADAGSSTTPTREDVTGLNFGERYTFQVRSVNTGVYSDASDTASTNAGHPGPPTRFEAEAGPGKVKLSWFPPVLGGTPRNYDYIYSPGGIWVGIGSPGTSITLVGDTVGFGNGTEYSFQVRARNAVSFSDHGGTKRATPKSGLPDSPTALTATAGDTEVTLAWTKPSGAITDHDYRYKAGSGYSEWASTGSTNATYKVTGLTNNTQYTFQVRAENGTGAGLSSDEASATPLAKPDKPTGLVAAPGDTAVTLSWDHPNNPTITNYQIQQDTGNWANINGSDADTTTHTVSSLTSGTEYSFKIRAVNAAGNSPESDAAATTPGAPAKPANLSAAGTGTSVTLTWDNPNDSTITKYQIQHKQDQNDWTTWADINDSNASTTTHTITGLAANTLNTFKIRAVNAAGNSPESDTASYDTTPPPPANPTPPPTNPPPADPTPPPESPPPESPPPESPPPESPPPESPPPESPPPESPPPGSTSPGSPPAGSPPGSPPPGSTSPGSPPPGSPPPPADDEASTGDDEEMEPAPSVEVRITARRLRDGRIEFALQQRTDGSWGSPRRPARRYFPPDTRAGRWLRSTTLNIDGQYLRIVARRLTDRRVEFGVQHRRGDDWSARILPSRRYFPTNARTGRWLSSTPLWANPHQPRPSVCNRTPQIAEALTEAADTPCADIDGADLGAIERLDLSGTGLRALRAADLGGLTGLTSLDLSDNRLSELTPGTLIHAPRLDTLDLSNNRITRFRNGALGGAGRLTTLNLSSNRLTSISSRTLSDAPSLRSINLAGNRIRRLTNNTFRGLENLRALNLTGNPGAPFKNLNTPDNTDITQ